MKLPEMRTTRLIINREIRHGILITLSLTAAILLFYLGDISWLGSRELDGGFFAGQAYHELCLLLLAGPVIYAAIIFRIKGGIIISLAASAAILPHTFRFSPYSDPLYRLATFTFVSMLLAGFIGSQLNSREKLEKERNSLKHFLSETIGVQERERRYLARELHDESLQLLVDISHDIDELLEIEAKDNDKTQLQRLHDNVDTVMEETRRFIRGLRPPLLEEMGLAMSLKWLIEELRENDGIEMTANIPDEEIELSETAELALFRIAQEALNNTKKHSGATRVELKLDFSGDRVILSITDNGTGFSVPSPGKLAEQGRFGLIGMRERARLAGGSLRIISTEGKGTVVTAVVPAK
jgi:signal transduction histidine kinase